MRTILIASIAWNIPQGQPRGIYNNHIVNFLHTKKANIWTVRRVVEHPINIKNSLGMIRGKNDKMDAQRIAVYAYKNRDEAHLWTPKRDVILKLDRLTALRNRLIKARKMMQAPLTDCIDFISKKDLGDAKKSCQNTLQALDKDIKKVNQDIQIVIQKFKRTLRFYRICKRYWPCHSYRNTYRYK